MGEAAANSNCGTVTLTEKSSMEGLPHTGLITDLEIQKSYLKKFGADLEVGENYQRTLGGDAKDERENRSSD